MVPFGNDPFYLFNPQPVQTKMTYYHVPWLPFFVFDGKPIEDVGDFSTWFRATIDSLLALPSPVRISLEQSPSLDLDSVYVSFDVVAVGAIPGSAPRVYVAVTEEYHWYPDPVGTWGYAFRAFVPGSTGSAATLEMGDSLHFDWSYPLDPVYDLNAVITNVFVQDYTTQAVFQAKSARVVDLASVDMTPGGAPDWVWLGQNSPNPFATETGMAYRLDVAGQVRLSVYSPTGRLVTHLVDAWLEPGAYSAAWDGRDAAGREAGSGVYYYRLDAREVSRSGRMVLLR